MKQNQQKRVLQALNRGRVLDRLSSWDSLGVPKLPSRISELIAQGYPIHKAWKKVYNRYGETCRVRCYWIPEYDRRD